MKQIEKYIQFAIDNGYNKNIEGITINYIDHNCVAFLGTNYLDTFGLIEIITSKSFIESITKGWWIDNEYNFDWQDGPNHTLEDYLTTTQAIAIRDNKLEDFINKLLPNKELGTE